MIAKFKHDCELIVCESVNLHTDEVLDNSELFKAGTRIEFDIIDHPLAFDMLPDNQLLNIQFGDGSMAFGVNRDWLEFES